MKFSVCLTIALLQATAVSATMTDEAERQALLVRQTEAVERIEALKREQDLLLFERSLSGTDSKYLVLDLAAGRFTLKYRGRTLRSFEATVGPSLRDGLRRGNYVLTRKEDGSSSGRALVFQEELVLHGRGYAKNSGGGKRTAGIAIGKMDLASLFFAVESGSRLFIH